MNNVQEARTAEHGQKKQVTIYVNTRPFDIAKEAVSFSEIVGYSGLPGGESVLFTVSYRRGQGNKPEGSLFEGESVLVKDGMIFNVTRTDKS